MGDKQGKQVSHRLDFPGLSRLTPREVNVNKHDLSIKITIYMFIYICKDVKTSNSGESLLVIVPRISRILLIICQLIDSIYYP